eukprot:4370891-Prymnesium_polylepis.1
MASRRARATQHARSRQSRRRRPRRAPPASAARRCGARLTRHLPLGWRPVGLPVGATPSPQVGGQWAISVRSAGDQRAISGPLGMLAAAPPPRSGSVRGAVADHCRPQRLGAARRDVRCAPQGGRGGRGWYAGGPQLTK